eukprot:CAMPEP_0202692724 /NCGR_PEP_ID=MMETSP1385-20130828/7027_1 /ASSEMBLY_ACC=CAM_ASM_000861 /TAXON_ID=933848 /ORGANISM="Elphidium margaritaceum" /LENGTH=408 /DNA_ID=CAMNT_0049348305 /DNA_START=16 /DNA_END=1242 /DNA_ORIENTATION=+
MRVDEVNNVDEHFEVIEKVGEGSYGLVFKCKRKTNGEIVAIKFIKKYNEDRKPQKKGLRIDIYREIQILNCLYDEELKYDYTGDRVTRLQQLLMGNMQHESTQYNLALVFEYYELSLSGIIRWHRKQNNNPNHDQAAFTDIFVQRLAYQILQGVQVLHQHWILHRDLKPSNILIDVRKSGGVVKLCDFGLSKIFQSYQTNGIHKQQIDGELVTLYYRAPELFLSSHHKYHESPALDVWSVGCILAELIVLRPIFKPDSNASASSHAHAKTLSNQLMMRSICFLLGIPRTSASSDDVDIAPRNANAIVTDFIWNGVENLCHYDDYNLYRWRQKHGWNGCLLDKGRLSHATRPLKELLRRLLTMDPDRRMSVTQAMNHEYFKSLRNDIQQKKQMSLLLFPNRQCPYMPIT